MFKNVALSIALAFSMTALAHEGHDDAPGALKANHGGTVKAGKELNLEYIVSGSEVTLYPISHEGKDLALTGLKVTATTKSPKGKPEILKLQAKDTAMVGTVDFKGAYRLEMNVAVESNGTSSNFKFQVEK